MTHEWPTPSFVDPRIRPIITGTEHRRVTGYCYPGVRRSNRPVVLFLHGLLSNPTGLAQWFHLLPGRDVILGALPGHQLAEPFAEPDIEAVAAAYLRFLGLVAPDRNITVVGESIGGVIALAMARSPKIARVVAADPPLNTEAVWALKDLASEAARHGQPVILDAINALIAPRDYRALLDDLAVPVDIIAAEEWLGARRTMRAPDLPSLLDPKSREAIRSAPRATLHVVGERHSLLRNPEDETIRIVADGGGLSPGAPLKP